MNYCRSEETNSYTFCPCHDIDYISKRSPHCSNSYYDDVIMGAIVSQITTLTLVYSTVYSGTDQSKHQSSASLAFVWGIQRGPVNSPHKWPVTRKMFPFDDVIVAICLLSYKIHQHSIPYMHTMQQYWPSNTHFNSCQGVNFIRWAWSSLILTHWGLVTPHDDIELGQHWLR